MQTFKELTTEGKEIVVRELDENWNVVWGFKVEGIYVSEELENAWSFYSTIWKAMLYADMYNFQKLVKAFEERILQACMQVSDEYKETF